MFINEQKLRTPIRSKSFCQLLPSYILTISSVRYITVAFKFVFPQANYNNPDHFLAGYRRIAAETTSMSTDNYTSVLQIPLT